MTPPTSPPLPWARGGHEDSKGSEVSSREGGGDERGKRRRREGAEEEERDERMVGEWSNEWSQARSLGD